MSTLSNVGTHRFLVTAQVVNPDPEARKSFPFVYSESLPVIEVFADNRAQAEARYIEQDETINSKIATGTHRIVSAEQSQLVFRG